MGIGVVTVVDADAVGDFSLREVSVGMFPRSSGGAAGDWFDCTGGDFLFLRVVDSRLAATAGLKSERSGKYALLVSCSTYGGGWLRIV